MRARRRDPDRRERIIEAALDVIADHGVAGTTHRSPLYLAPLRDPALRVVTQGWMSTSRQVLERFVDPTTARAVDALVEGLVMHTTLATSAPPRDEIRSIVRQAVGGTGD